MKKLVLAAAILGTSLLGGCVYYPYGGDPYGYGGPGGAYYAPAPYYGGGGVGVYYDSGYRHRYRRW